MLRSTVANSNYREDNSNLGDVWPLNATDLIRREVKRVFILAVAMVTEIMQSRK